MDFRGFLSHLGQRKMLIVLALGFSSGLPLGLTGATLQAWYTVENVDIVTIGFLSLVGQPYVYKFIWAPFMDKVTPPLWGRRRGWMLFTQIGLMVCLGCIAMMSPKQSPIVLGALALCLAFMSASQDIAIDAYRTEILSNDEKGTGAAMAVAGYRGAMLVSGGVTLIMAQFIGFQLTYLAMIGLVGVGMLAVWLGKEPYQYAPTPKSFRCAFIEPFKEFLNRPQAIALLALIVLYKFGDAFAGNLTTAFLIRKVGFDLVQVGALYKAIALMSMLVGAIAGGYLIAKMGLYKALMWFGIIQALSNLSYLVLAWVGQNYTVLVLAVFCENFGGGMGTGAFLALLMSLCDPRYTATQFALLSALSAVGRVFVGPLAGYVVKFFGWEDFFIFSVIISIPGLLLLWALRKSIVNHVMINRTHEASLASS